MLDTHGRRFVEPAIARVARAFRSAGVSANTVTYAAMIVGVVGGLLVAASQPWWGICALWLSGTLDAVDGALARLTRSTPLGAILDIAFDRIVEMSFIVALAVLYPESRLLLVVLAGTIAVAMSLFLAIAAAVPNVSAKSFHYAPGVGERTEAFVCLTMMIADQEHLSLWTLLFIVLMVVTMAQRYVDASRILSSVGRSEL